MNALKFKMLTVGILLACATSAFGGAASSAVREASEAIGSRFGRGAAGAAVEDASAVTARTAGRYGDEALPLLRATGPAGASALDQAGAKAPEVIRLFSRRGDDAVWIISEPKRLAIFVKHGDPAADALLKHRGIADSLITHHGADSIGAMNALSRGGAQRMAMASEDGVFRASGRSAELIGVIQRHGDAAMDFIWRNKGSLAVASVLASFLRDPAVYINGVKDLIVNPIVAPIAQNTNWTLLIGGALGVFFLPFIFRSFAKARLALKSRPDDFRGS